MNDQEINVAIAEACGWTVFENTICDPRPIIKNGVQTGDVNMNPVANLPDYCNDLNAMHKAEKTLLKEGNHSHGCYCSYLFERVYNCMCATARQRAEAFLKTIGGWKE